MKLCHLFVCLSVLVSSFNVVFAAEDAGLRYIQTRGTVRCGTDIQTKAFANKDEDGFWHGFDVDICKEDIASLFSEI